MEKETFTQIRSNLSTTIQSAGKRPLSGQRRESNIEWIENLPREGLSYGQRERQILMHTTALGEKIFIQYPGKETVRSTPRPWDFRPELYLPENSARYENMSFGDIWAIVFETAAKLSGNNKDQFLRVFATLFYRMAFMLDHIETPTFNTRERDVIYGHRNEPEFSEEREVELPKLLKYDPNQEALEYLSNACPMWGSMSVEAFLFYNELLVWNEDCKYYYRNYRTREKQTWIGTTGRVNTLLTHIHILGYMLGDVHLSDIFDGFAKQKGISPASKDKVIRICRDFIKEE